MVGGGAEDDTRAMFAFLDQDGDGFVDPQDWVDGLCGVDSNTELAGDTPIASCSLLLPRREAGEPFATLLCCPNTRMCEQASAMAA